MSSIFCRMSCNSSAENPLSTTVKPMLRISSAKRSASSWLTWNSRTAWVFMSLSIARASAFLPMLQLGIAEAGFAVVVTIVEHVNLLFVPDDAGIGYHLRVPAVGGDINANIFIFAGPIDPVGGFGITDAI